MGITDIDTLEQLERFRIWRSPRLPSAEIQVDNMRRWNQQHEWGFAPSDFPEEEPSWQPRTPGEVLVLVAYLPSKRGRGANTGCVRTVGAYLEVMGENFSVFPDDQLKFDRTHFGLTEATEERHTYGVRFMVIDLEAHLWEPHFMPRRVSGEAFAHAEALAAIVHFGFDVVGRQVLPGGYSVLNKVAPNGGGVITLLQDFIELSQVHIEADDPFSPIGTACLPTVRTP